MTEAQWLASTDPAAMLEWLTSQPGNSAPRHDPLRPAITDRQLRLFACASARLLEDSPPHPERTAVIEACEQIADGLPSQWGKGVTGLVGARKSIDSVWGWIHTATCERVDVALRETLIGARGNAGKFDRQEDVAALLRDIAGNPWRSDHVHIPYHHDWQRDPTVISLALAAYERRKRKCPTCNGLGGSNEDTGGSLPWGDPIYDWEDCHHCHGTGTIDGTLDPLTLAVLADALEEAGVSDGDLLRHLRGWERCWLCARCGDAGLCSVCGSVTSFEPATNWIPLRGPHVRGCWALDPLRNEKPAEVASSGSRGEREMRAV